MSVTTEDATRLLVMYVQLAHHFFLSANHHSHRVLLVTEGSIQGKGRISAKSQRANERKHWPGSRANFFLTT